MNRELGDNRMDSDQKFWLGLILGGGSLAIVLILSIMIMNQVERQSYLDAGLQECKYALVGNVGATISWMKECPTGGIGAIVPYEENVK